MRFYEDERIKIVNDSSSEYAGELGYYVGADPDYVRNVIVELDKSGYVSIYPDEIERV